jgi:hypothetical protein
MAQFDVHRNTGANSNGYRHRVVVLKKGAS